jgi:exonuclease SbcC
MGENGAGKTTIIEAVAWALFDLLDYKKDDFVRRGAKKGIVHVTFESGLDERKYTVYRDTGTGYAIFDPELGAKIRDKKEDVTNFLREHLGVEPGTDLELLFRSAIGVPQGTFTAIFLDTAANRKNAFDKLLKVEEYRQSAEKLLATARYVEYQVINVREKIARAEGELSRFDQVESESKDIAARLIDLNKSLEDLRGEVTKKRAEAAKLETEEAKIKEIQASLEKLKSELMTTEVLLKQKQNEVDSAKRASEKVKAVEADHLSYLEALSELKILEAQRGERDRILSETKNVETTIIKIEAEQKNLQAALERAEKAEKEIAALDTLIKQQKELENRREHLRTKQAQAKASRAHVGEIESKLIGLREDFRKTETDVKEAQEKSKAAADVEVLSQQETKLTRRIAALQAKLESDERFQREIKNGLCPILTEKCLNLKEGQTLEAFVSSQFDETKAEIENSEKEQAKLAISLKAAREAGQFLKALETLQKRHEEVKALGLKLGEDKRSAEKRAGELIKIESDLAETEKSLIDLKNPRERAEALLRETENIAEVKSRIAKNEKELKAFQKQKASVEKEAEKFAALDADWTRFSTERDRTSDAHREYLSNELLAKTLPERETELKNIANESEKLKAGLEIAGQTFSEASKNYDAEKHMILKVDLSRLEKDLTETNAHFSIAQKRKIELETELARLQEIRISMQAEFKEKERLEKIGEATKFIRDTLKEAAPRVARNYVYHVSSEANQVFREITGKPERSLKWADDYAVMLEEGGYERPFQSLSGGEQMAAALSIRLALLKQLSDVRLAFFDEPTTNMDAERRENLAQQISQITQKHTFDQLFVVSHDDTFEEYVDNVVTLGESSAGVPPAVVSASR